ncbi:MAG: DUF262 domain-containing protein [Burkholderiaceae bacterium]|jgi:hypothetical protein|nr:DUF262 domain-containing protein [Burkholderiaceae bacterium]
MPLLDGEELDFTVEAPAPVAPAPDDIVNEKYVRGEIRIVTEQARYPLNTIPALLEGSAYDLSPEYQRRHRWSVVQRSRLIESLIMNVPIPPIFLYEYDYSKYEVMDGLQRLTTIRTFYRDEFALAGLTQWPELNGRAYTALPEKVREGIDRRYLSSVILLKETAKNAEDALRLKQMVFERINSGGAKLTPQETRNAIFDGPLNRLSIKLSKNASLCRLWDLPLPDAAELAGGQPSEERQQSEDFRRMEDVELVLRFFAFRQKHRLHKSTVPLSVYFDNFLRFGNGFPPPTLQALEQMFLDTIALIEAAFGEKAFWLYRQRRGQWSWMERPTTTVYDALMAVVSWHLDKRDRILAKASALQVGIERFYQNNYDTFEGRNVNPSALQAREKALEGFLTDTLAQA